MTNLKLNKLVYLAQVEALKLTGEPLFDGRIEAWQYGPVEPSVYHMYKRHGNGVIERPAPGTSTICDDAELGIIDKTLDAYGWLSAYDLVEYTHREGSAWSNVYAREQGGEITLDDIRSSSDFLEEPDFGMTFAAGVRKVEKRWPNALRMLEDA